MKIEMTERHVTSPRLAIIVNGGCITAAGCSFNGSARHPGLCPRVMRTHIVQTLSDETFPV